MDAAKGGVEQERIDAGPSAVVAARFIAQKAPRTGELKLHQPKANETTP